MANKIARKLRKTMTPQEVKLWAHLRRLRSEGFKFRRQVPLLGFVVDFACFGARLIVELDGSQHGFAEYIERDRLRDAVLERGGFTVLRFWNAEIDHEFDGVWSAVLAALQNADLRAPWIEDFGAESLTPE